jgi:large subunit ribosomal protein L16
VAGLEEDVAREALRLAAHKLPIRTQFIGRRDIVVSSGGEQ